MKRTLALILIVALPIGGCETAGFALPLSITDGDYVLSFSGGGETCLTIQNERVVFVAGGCNQSFTILHAPLIVVSQDVVILDVQYQSPTVGAFSITFNGNRQSDGTFHGTVTFRRGTATSNDSAILRQV